MGPTEAFAATMSLRRTFSKLALLLGASLAVLVLVGVPGLGQGVIEPEGELASADCYGHHKQEGFRSMDLFPTVLAQVPRGQPFEFQLTIRNPWLHELQDVFAYVNTSSAPSIGFPGERDPTLLSEQGSIASSNPTTYQVATHKLQVDANATDMFVTVTGTPGQAPVLPGGVAVQNDFDLRLKSPNGEIEITGPDDRANDQGPTPTNPTWVETVQVPPQALTLGGPGEWTIEVAYRGASNPGTYDLAGGVYYNLSKTTQLILPGPKLLNPGEEHVFTFSLLARDLSLIHI